MSQSTSPHTVSFHKLAGGTGIARVRINPDLRKVKRILRLFVVDNSGSMGGAADAFAKKTIPMLFAPDADPETPLYLIPFSDSCEVWPTTLGMLRHISLPEQCGTRLNGVFAAIELIAKENPDTDIEMVVLSDGIVTDLYSVLDEAERCNAHLKSTGVRVDVKTLRLQINRYGGNGGNGGHYSYGGYGYGSRGGQGRMGSKNEADTEALTHFLLLSSTPSSEITDLEAYELAMPSKIASLKAKGDEAGRAVVACAGCLVSLAPYTKHTASVVVPSGETLLFLEGEPEAFSVDGVGVVLERCNLAPGIYFDSLLGPALKRAITYVKNFKVADVEGAAEKITDCTRAFEKILGEMHGAEAVDHMLADAQGAPGAGERDERDRSLRRRLGKFKRHSLAVLMRVANTALDQNFSNQQKADYLRDDSTATRAGARVAKRSRRTTGDVDELRATILAEVEKAKCALPSLEDDDEHDPNYRSLQSPVSFWSQATTAEGLRALLSLEREELELMSLEDLLLSLNIVGFPAFCASENPDFAGAFDWSPDEVYVKGYFISIADIMAARLMFDTPDKSAAVVGLTIPRTDLPISIIIPCVMPNLMRFLVKNMPIFLNALALLGSQRVHGCINGMNMGVLLSGALRLADQIASPGGISEASICAFRGVMATAVAASGPYFNHILEAIGRVSGGNFANLDNQPIKYAMVPLFQIFTDPRFEHLRATAPAILRSVAAAMAYLLARAAKRSATDREDKLRAEEEGRKEESRKQHAMLGGQGAFRWEDRQREMKNPDFELMQALLGESSTDSQFGLAERLVGQLKHRMRGANALVQLFRAMGGAPDPSGFPSMHEALGLDPSTTVDRFLFALCVLGFDAPSKDARIDKDTGESIQADLGLPGAAEEYISRKTRECREAEESARAAAARKDAEKRLGSVLVERLAGADLADFEVLLRDGLEESGVRAAVGDSTSPLVSSLSTALLSPEVPHRAVKMLWFYSGKIGERDLWNRGRPLFVSSKDIRKINDAACDEALAEFFSLKLKHVYREPRLAHNEKTKQPVEVEANRHSHSNGLPSYFALGHATLNAYIEHLGGLAAEERDHQWAEYRGLHPKCCGTSEAVVPW